MKLIVKYLAIVFLSFFSCQESAKEKDNITAANILGNPEYKTICYSGYRETDRSVEPTKVEIKADLKLLHAMGIRVLRTYNVYLPQVKTMLETISELKQEDNTFKMYVMLGAWISCKNAFTDQQPDHGVESEENHAEIERAIALANKYPDIVKIIAVGNEAMVHWAAAYYVQPKVILKWVKHLQQLKLQGKLPKDVWITSSDDFSSWGGGDAVYHTKELEQLVKVVDYISMHTYPMHNTHYNPEFWWAPENEEALSTKEQIDKALLRALEFAKTQYDSVSNYMKSLGVNKPIHIGETGWATKSNGFYSAEGSRACDEYKSAKYYRLINNWAAQNKISCFYFEAFDEPWKDAENPMGSENHFGLFTVDGKAKHAIWDLVDQGVFNGLHRGGNAITKTFNGDNSLLMNTLMAPPLARDKNKEND